MTNTDIPLISIITPTRLLKERMKFFLELIKLMESIHEEMNIEWIVVADGPTENEFPEYLEGYSWVRIVKLHKNVGAASARNIGLHHCSGDYVAICDDDDLITLDGLKERLRIATENNYEWVGGLLADLLPDGSLSIWDSPQRAGHVPAGDLLKTWGAPERMFPIGPSTILFKTGLVRAVGGWQGLPQAEDFGLCIAFSSIHPGNISDEVVYIYRKHEDQMTKESDFMTLEPIVREIVFTRGLELSVINN